MYEVMQLHLFPHQLDKFDCEAEKLVFVWLPVHFLRRKKLAEYSNCRLLYACCVCDMRSFREAARSENFIDVLFLCMKAPPVYFQQCIVD